MHQSLTSSNLFKSKDHTKYLIDVYERSNGGIAAIGICIVYGPQWHDTHLRPYGLHDLRLS